MIHLWLVRLLVWFLDTKSVGKVTQLQTAHEASLVMMLQAGF